MIKKEMLEYITKLCLDNNLSVMINMKIDTTKEAFFIPEDKEEGILYPKYDIKDSCIEYNEFMMDGLKYEKYLADCLENGTFKDNIWRDK